MEMETIRWEDNHIGSKTGKIPPYRVLSESDIPDSPGDLTETQLKRLKKYRELSIWLTNETRRNRIIRIGDISADIDQDDVLFDRINDTIRTRNYVGVIQLPNSEEGPALRVEIHSRFDSDERAWFLLYLLSQVYGFRADMDLGIASRSGDTFAPILCVLFFERLRTAYGKGLYKVYRSFRHNDYAFRGALDVNRHIRLNTPFLGKTAFTTREHTYDNDVLCLIRQTLKYVQSRYPGIWNNYLESNWELAEIERVIEGATPSFLGNAAYQDTELCRHEIVHPLYRDYEEVRLLCRRILNDEAENPYMQGTEDSFSLLVDMAWLWEEFVGKCLLDALAPNEESTDENRFRHLRRGEDSTGRAPRLYRNDKEEGVNPRYPDFIQNADQTKPKNVLDAKYKRWDFNREDVYQLMVYLFLTGGSLCGAIYPVAATDGRAERDFQYRTLNPFSGFYGENVSVACYKLPFCVPQVAETGTYADFCDAMNAEIKGWKTRLKETLS